MSLLLDALVEYTRTTGGIPAPIAVWLEEQLLPAVFGTNQSLSAAEQDVVRALVRMLVNVQCRTCAYDEKNGPNDPLEPSADDRGRL